MSDMRINPAEKCAFCGFAYGMHGQAAESCPIPPASKDHGWQWDTRTFKSAVNEEGVA